MTGVLACCVLGYVDERASDAFGDVPLALLPLCQDMVQMLIALQRMRCYR